MRRIGFVFTAALFGLPAVLIVPVKSDAQSVGQSVKITALEAFAQRFEGKLGQTPGPFGFQVLSTAPAIYVQGVGAVLSSVVSLSYIDQPSPFREPFTPKELAAARQRKVDRVPLLEQNMREVMAETAAAGDIDPVPPNERIVLGVTLFYFKWEDSSGLPRQIIMSAEKQKLLQARRTKVDLATVIQEQKL